MLYRGIIILLTVACMAGVGCDKVQDMKESGITIDKAITVLEAAKSAEKIITAGNAKSIAEELLKDIEKDSGKDDE
ncbi:MAG TPA: hypothetical protein PKM65_06950 [Spirochaetota bacterium]|nr:hypothetical protein [Spirochaetota bacterium]HNT09904.1 hypothetical protein [Spirochaetota bacterium]